MPKITVRQSPIDGRLFKCDKEYASYLNFCREQNHERYKKKRMIKEWDVYFKEKRDTLNSIEAIINWIKTDIKKIIYYGYHTEQLVGHYTHRLCDVTWKYAVEDITLESSFRIGDHSNSHRYPYSGVRNWGLNNPTLPKSYKAVNGRFFIGNTGTAKFSGTSLLKFCGIKAADAGGGKYHSKGEFVMFKDDWPALFKEFEADAIVRRLEGKK